MKIRNLLLLMAVHVCLLGCAELSSPIPPPSQQAPLTVVAATATPDSIATTAVDAPDSTPTINNPRTADPAALKAQQLAALQAIRPDYAWPEDYCHWDNTKAPLTKCDEQGNVVELNAADWGLTRLPPAIILFPHLENLQLPSNQLTRLPPQLGQLTQLKILNLHANKLTSLPRSIRQLTSLEELDLSENQLATLPTEIVELSHLKKIDLTKNPINTLPPESCVKLKTLVIPSNLCP